MQGLIFDLDGTLADTIPICIEAFQHTVALHSDRMMSSAEVVSMFGPTEEGMLKACLSPYPQEALETYLTKYEKLHQNCAQPFSGLSSTLKILRDNGVLLAIVTGKGARSAKISCRLLGVGSYFDILEYGSDDGPMKPVSLDRVMTQWNLPKDSIAYVGDTASDVKDARKVGIQSVAAAWASSADFDALSEEHPDFIFTTVADFEVWIKSWI